MYYTLLCEWFVNEYEGPVYTYHTLALSNSDLMVSDMKIRWRLSPTLISSRKNSDGM